MSWKKNAISYIMWFFYVLLIEAVMLLLADVVCEWLDVSIYWGVFLAVLYAAVTGVIVFVSRSIYSRFALKENKKLQGVVFEAVLAVGLFALGLWFRVQNLDDVSQSAAYFEVAQVSYGQTIPQVVHGAVYIYLQALRSVLLFVGNHFIAGIWLQIVLQLLAVIVLYFVMKKLTGTVGALITLAICMCGSFMVQQALVLSPEMLYFLITVLVLAVSVLGCEKKLYPAYLTFCGVLAGMLTYLDVMGAFLLVYLLAQVFCVREESAGAGRKAFAFCCGILGFALGFLGCIQGDAWLSGKKFVGVLGAWGQLYMPESFSLPVSVGEADSTWQLFVLVGLMVVGIFSFWLDKRQESLVVSVPVLLGIALMCCFGMFTEDMPGYTFLYLTFAVVAGASVNRIFVPAVPVFTAEEDESNDALTNISEENSVDEQVETEEAVALEEEVVSDKPKVQFIENPLPLPKRHEKKTIDYAVELTEETEDFDISVSEEDDFDQ